MQMIDVLKRLAELDAQNPNIVSEVSKELATKAYNKMAVGDDPWKNRTGLAGDQSDRIKARMDKRWGKDKVDAAVQKSREQGKTNESLEECGMMGGMSQPHSPASINMTAATGEELSSMLKDIMTLAGQQMQEPMDGADGVAVVDMEPSDDSSEPGPEVGQDEPSIMRSMIDRLNPGDDEEEQDDDKKVDEYDNTPQPEVSGYDAAVPSGNDLHKEKKQYPAAQPGDNPMTMEQILMSEYKKFLNET